MINKSARRAIFLQVWDKQAETAGIQSAAQLVVTQTVSDKLFSVTPFLPVYVCVFRKVEKEVSEQETGVGRRAAWIFVNNPATAHMYFGNLRCSFRKEMETETETETGEGGSR